MPRQAKSIDATITDLPTLFRVWQLFWEKVDVRGEDECWPWTGCVRNKKGYGSFRSRALSHRYAFYLTTGIDPIDDVNVLHTCDNPPCCNPKHLYAGTHQQNMADALNRDRFTRGEASAVTKLTDEQVEEIRRRWLDGEGQAVLAKEFGVSQPSIWFRLQGCKSEQIHDGYAPQIRAPELRPYTTTVKSPCQRRLTAEMIQQIRTRVAAGETQTAVARDFSLAPGYISRIVNRKLYKRYV